MNLLDRMFLRPMQEFGDGMSYAPGFGPSDASSAPVPVVPPPDNAWMADLAVDLDPLSGLDYVPEATVPALNLDFAATGSLPVLTTSSYADPLKSAMSSVYKPGIVESDLVSGLTTELSKFRYTPETIAGLQNDMQRAGVPKTATEQIVASLKPQVLGVPETTYLTTQAQEQNRLDTKADRALATGTLAAQQAGNVAFNKGRVPLIERGIAALPEGPRKAELLSEWDQLRPSLNDPNITGSVNKALGDLDAKLGKESQYYRSYQESKPQADALSAKALEVLNDPQRAGKYAVADSMLRSALKSSANPDLSFQELASKQSEIIGVAAEVVKADTIASAARTPKSAWSLEMVDGYGRSTGDTNFGAIPLYLSIFGAIAGPVLAAQESKKNRQFQMDLYNLQRQNAREDLQWQYDLRAAYGEDSASVAAAQASAGKAAGAPVSKANINLSKAKVKVS